MSKLRIVAKLKSSRAGRRTLKVVSFFASQIDKAVIAFAAVLAFLFTPDRTALGASFNIDMGGLMDTAAEIFNGIWPAFAIIAGLTLGFLILKFVLNAIKGAFSGG